VFFASRLLFANLMSLLPPIAASCTVCRSSNRPKDSLFFKTAFLLPNLELENSPILQFLNSSALQFDTSILSASPLAQVNNWKSSKQLPTQAGKEF